MCQRPSLDRHYNASPYQLLFNLSIRFTTLTFFDHAFIVIKPSCIFVFNGAQTDSSQVLFMSSKARARQREE